ncbi:unnamed protein product, partial [Schistosoma margrebowiei]
MTTTTSATTSIPSFTTTQSPTTQKIVNTLSSHPTTLSLSHSANFSTIDLFYLPVQFTPFSGSFVDHTLTPVSTNYWIDSTIYHQSNNTAIDWDASYADTTSLNYAVLSTRYCDLIMRTLQKAPLTANKQKSCTKVIFTPRQILIIWEKRQATTNTSSNVVGGNATIQINTTSIDVINATEFSNAFITTY